jgi:hypothetical protein
VLVSYHRARYTNRCSKLLLVDPVYVAGRPSLVPFVQVSHGCIRLSPSTVILQLHMACHSHPNPASHFGWLIQKEECSRVSIIGPLI